MVGDKEDKRIIDLFKCITRLVKQSTCIQSRRKILQKPQVGDGVLDIISSLVIPALLKLYLG